MGLFATRFVSLSARLGSGFLAVIVATGIRGEDLAGQFPNPKLQPLITEPDVDQDGEHSESLVKTRDFPEIVAEAKREALGFGPLGRRSVAENLPSQQSGGTMVATVAHTKPNCGSQKNPCPPQRPPQSPRISGNMADATAPLPDVAAPVQVQAAVPNLGRQLSRAGVAGLRETYADTPVLVGDGCAPFASSGRLPVPGYRTYVFAPGVLPSGGALVGSGPYGINLPAPNQPNSIQAIAAQGPGFVLPSTPYGSVSAAPIPITGSTGGITTVDSPSSFQAAVESQYASDPTLASYANRNPEAQFVPGASGAMAATTPGLQDAYLFYDYVVDASLLMPGAAVGFVKLTENMSPLPRDRVYMNYSYFRNANFFYERADVNRFMPGFEKTFYDGWTSIEVRTPFAATLSNSQWVTSSPGCQGTSEYRDIQFGNMSVIFKTLLIERQTWAITGGVQVMLPTAADTNLFYATAADPQSKAIQSVFVDNQSTHVMPFFGGVWAPNERFFSQGLLQVDIDSNGNPAYVNPNMTQGLRGDALTSVGRLYMPTFMYMSFGTGYWLYRNNNANFTGFSPIMEVHVNQGMSAFNPIVTDNYVLGANPGVVSVTNGLVGCNFEWGQRSTLTLAYVTPLGGGVDRFFDGELRALFNWRFGPQNRLTRAQF